MSVKDKVKQQKKRPKKDRFLRMRMWISYLLSMLEKDRGKIPDNIGNKILITNNVYVTKAYISSVIQITSLTIETPVTLVGELTRILRDEGSTAILDCKIKNQNYDVQLKESGLLSRIALWEKTMELENIPDREKEVAARCLYTVGVVRSGRKLMKSRVFLTIRAKKGSELQKAESIVYKYLTGIGALYLPVTANLKQTLQYISLLSNYRNKSVKDVKAIVNSEQTLSQMLPNSSSTNGTRGLYMGVNIENNSEFKLDLERITGARNIYVIAPSGVGKTVLALNLCCSAVEQPNWAVCVQDIKGNEFTTFIKSTSGYIVSLKQKSSGYVNSWRLNKDNTSEEGAAAYYTARIDFSKKQMMILSGISNSDSLTDLEELLDEFHDSLYISLGVLAANRNTWAATRNLDPFVVYEAFVEYMTPAVQSKYDTVSKKVLTALRMYMSRNGSKSYLFKQEFDYAAILRSRTLMFDFGILDGAHNAVDPVIFRLKFSYMQRLNAEFVSYKYSKGIKVLKVLEESQIAVDHPEIMGCYVEEYTLRRAQGQTTLLLGNSIAALVSNTMSKPLIENTRALLIGKLPPDAKNEVVRRFGLQEKEEVLDSIGSDVQHDNTFLFINNMQSHSLTPLLKVILDTDKLKSGGYKLLTPVAQTNAMAD